MNGYPSNKPLNDYYTQKNGTSAPAFDQQDQFSGLFQTNTDVTLQDDIIQSQQTLESQCLGKISLPNEEFENLFQVDSNFDRWVNKTFASVSNENKNTSSSFQNQQDQHLNVSSIFQQCYDNLLTDQQLKQPEYEANIPDNTSVANTFKDQLLGFQEQLEKDKSFQRHNNDPLQQVNYYDTAQASSGSQSSTERFADTCKQDNDIDKVTADTPSSLVFKCYSCQSLNNVTMIGKVSSHQQIFQIIGLECDACYTINVLGTSSNSIDTSVELYQLTDKTATPSTSTDLPADVFETNSQRLINQSQQHQQTQQEQHLSLQHKNVHNNASRLPTQTASNTHRNQDVTEFYPSWSSWRADTTNQILSNNKEHDDKEGSGDSSDSMKSSRLQSHICMKCVPRKRNMKHQVSTSHPVSFKCFGCHKGFSRIYIRARHQERCPKTSCSACRNICSRKDSLLRHQKSFIMHMITYLRKKICYACRRTFSRKDSLKRHIRTRHLELYKKIFGPKKQRPKMHYRIMTFD